MDENERRRVAFFFRTLREQTSILERAVEGDPHSQAQLFGTYGDVIEAWCADLYGKGADVAEVKKLAEQYGIRSIPSLVFFKDGKEVTRAIGALPKAKLAAVIQQVVGTDQSATAKA